MPEKNPAIIRATNEPKTEPHVLHSGLNAFFSESAPESDFQTSGLNRPTPRDPLFALADSFNNLALELRRDKPPAIPKPTFSGKVHECPFKFLNSITEWLTSNHIFESREQTQIAAAQLRDEAKTWYEPMRPFITNFGEFNRRLLEKFNSVEILTKLRVELFGADQKPLEGVEPFLTKKNFLFNRLYPNEPERNRVELCITLLRPELRNRLRIGTFPTVESLMSTATLIAADLAEDTRFRRSNGPTQGTGFSANSGTVARAQPQQHQRQLPWRQNGQAPTSQRRENQPPERPTNARVLALCDAQNAQVAREQSGN